MAANQNEMSKPGISPDQAENSYCGDPCQLHYEQYGLEYLDRNGDTFDGIDRVVILGCN